MKVQLDWESAEFQILMYEIGQVPLFLSFIKGRVIHMFLNVVHIKKPSKRLDNGERKQNSDS